MHEAVDGLRLERDGLVATLVIDRPERRNALARRHWNALPPLVAKAEGARVLVVRGAGDTFCAGADISEFATERAAGERARDYERANVGAFEALARAPVPTIALIRGHALGGGFGLAAACDLRFAVPDATFGVPAARLGLAYPPEAMARLVEAVGAMRARHMLLSGAMFAAEAVDRWGFLTAIVDADGIDAHVAGLARDVAENAPLTIAAARAAIRGDGNATALADRTFGSADYAEGVAAFAAKRPPRFEGR